MGAEHYGAERGETALEKAEQIIAVELRRRRRTEAELKKRPKGDPVKVKLAQRLRDETVQTGAWIAQRLHMGSRAYANHLLWRAKQR